MRRVVFLLHRSDTTASAIVATSKYSFLDPFKTSVVKLFIPPVANAKAPFRSTTDIDYHHGSFVGQYCQGQAQEITVEVILCKYSRQVEGGASGALSRAIVNGVVCLGGGERRQRQVE